MEKEPNILVVDDEKAIADLVGKLLSDESMNVYTCYSGSQALSIFGQEDIDLIVLDIMMPGVDGFEVCTKVRAVSEVPIIFLSAKDEEADKVIGLTLGGDDYISKPFKSRELVARVKARLRRLKRAEPSSSSILRARGIELDLDAHKVSLHDESLNLAPKEFAILALLIKACGKPVSAQEIFESVWHEPFSDTTSNTVMVHIRQLRKKLATVDSSENLIETAWGIGYKISSGGK